ncbi:MAG: hypothetical protein H6Q51_1166 [Deltaproteobacteria bacterium]|nr:hypothetical protein [Deltaproteobacteria bacterium]
MELAHVLGADPRQRFPRSFHRVRIGAPQKEHPIEGLLGHLFRLLVSGLDGAEGLLHLLAELLVRKGRLREGFHEEVEAAIQVPGQNLETEGGVVTACPRIQGCAHEVQLFVERLG